VIAPRYALLQKAGVQATLSDINIFMASDGGKSARYQARRRKCVHIHIDGIEPMSAPDRMALGEEVVAKFKGVS
jgi:hypothetical protein